MGKLDAAVPSGGVVNGPEDAVFDWDAVNWRAVEDGVRRLRQRIFTASKAGDLCKVRNLQKLMLRCRSNVLLSTRRVTEINAGRRTAGVDGQVALTPKVKQTFAEIAKRSPRLFAHWSFGLKPDGWAMGARCAERRTAGSASGGG